MAKSEHYVSNKKFYDLMCEYITACKEAEANNEPVPRIPDSIGRKIKLIAERLSRRPNFSGYTYRDEMVSDAIENCIMYLRCFDPEKSKNPFSYFTQICYYSFVRRIKKENTEHNVRMSIVAQFPNQAEFDTQAHDDPAHFSNSNCDFLRDLYGERAHLNKSIEHPHLGVGTDNDVFVETTVNESMFFEDLSE